MSRGERFDPIFVPDVGIRAEEAALSWIGDAPPEYEDLPQNELMLLGRPGGTIFVYDVTERRTVQIPDAEVIVSIRR